MKKKKLKLQNKTLDEKIAAVQRENEEKLAEMRVKRKDFIANGGQMGLFELHKKPLPNKNGLKLV